MAEYFSSVTQTIISCLRLNWNGLEFPIYAMRMKGTKYSRSTVYVCECIFKRTQKHTLYITDSGMSVISDSCMLRLEASASIYTTLDSTQHSPKHTHVDIQKHVCVGSNMAHNKVLLRRIDRSNYIIWKLDQRTKSCNTDVKNIFFAKWIFQWKDRSHFLRRTNFVDQIRSGCVMVSDYI